MPGISTIDGTMPEAHRAASVALMAITRGDQKAAADVIRTFDNPRDAWIVTASLAAALLADQDDPDTFLRAYLDAGSESLATAVSRARDLLRKELEDGKPHSYVRIRALAMSQGIKAKDLRNAAQQLGVTSGNVNQADHWYRLPGQQPRKTLQRKR